MKQVKIKKSLVDKLMSLSRDLWKNIDGLSDAELTSFVSRLITIVGQINFQASQYKTDYKFFPFDDLAGIVASNNLSDDCYYQMLRVCGFEVV